MKEEKFSRLRDAYAIIDGIPDKRFHLSMWVQRKRGCGTLACAAGWLAQHPDFIEQGFKLENNGDNGEWQYPSYCGADGFSAIADFFGLKYLDAEALFAARLCTEKYDPPNRDGISDKELWKARVRNFLKVKA